MALKGLGALEARLAELRREMEEGLGERAEEIGGVVERLAAADEAETRAELKSHAHRLRGIAGTHGHAELGEIAARVETAAAALETRQTDLVRLGKELAEAARGAGPAKPQTIPPIASEPPRPTGKLRVLAVDDDAAMRKLVELTLRNMGAHEVTIASSSSDALAAIDHQPFDVVLIDAMMPGMNGLELCRAIRCRGGLETLPLIILSAASPDELGWTLGEKGPTAWLRKPFRPDALLAEINRIAGVAVEYE